MLDALTGRKRTCVCVLRWLARYARLRVGNRGHRYEKLPSSYLSRYALSCSQSTSHLSCSLTTTTIVPFSLCTQAPVDRRCSRREELTRTAACASELGLLANRPETFRRVHGLLLFIQVIRLHVLDKHSATLRRLDGFCGDATTLQKQVSSFEGQNNGETGNRTQNLLHLTRAIRLDAKKMSYH